MWVEKDRALGDCPGRPVRTWISGRSANCSTRSKVLRRIPLPPRRRPAECGMLQPGVILSSFYSYTKQAEAYTRISDVLNLLVLATVHLVARASIGLNSQRTFTIRQRPFHRARWR
jgi:hypothetical protein